MLLYVATVPWPDAFRIVIASCVLMATTAVRLVPEAAPNLGFLLLAAGGFIVLATTRVPPVFVIIVSAAFGVLLR